MFYFLKVWLTISSTYAMLSKINNIENMYNKHASLKKKMCMIMQSFIYITL